MDNIEYEIDLVEDDQIENHEPLAAQANLIEAAPVNAEAAQSISDEDKEALRLERIAEREAMLERYKESQTQIQAMQNQIEDLKKAQASRPDNSANNELSVKRQELERVKQEYQAAKSSFNVDAEIAAMTKFGNLQWEIKELERQGSNVPSVSSNPVQNQNRQIQQNTTYDPNQRGYDMLQKFSSKPENAWMQTSFDGNLTPITQEGVIANNLFAKLSAKGHPGTNAFWDLYQYELSKALPAKYPKKYGKGSPAVSGGSTTISTSPSKAQTTTRLDPWEKVLVDRLSSKSKDKDATKRIAQSLKAPVTNGVRIPGEKANLMFELGL